MQGNCWKAVVVILCFLCTGCVGIAHQKVAVPPLAIYVQGSQKQQLDILCPAYYADTSTFIEIIKDSLDAKSYGYDWKHLDIHPPSAASITCREEDRYLGSLVVLFAVFGPNDIESRSRHLYVRVSGDTKLYRINRLAESQNVEELDILGLREKLPAILAGPVPSVPSTSWNEYDRVLTQYYDSMKWQPSNRISLSNIQSDRAGAVLSVQMTINQER